MVHFDTLCCLGGACFHSKEIGQDRRRALSCYSRALSMDPNALGGRAVAGFGRLLAEAVATTRALHVGHRQIDDVAINNCFAEIASAQDTIR